jgi:hypothetical protein
MTQIMQFLRRAVQTNGRDIATVCGERVHAVVRCKRNGATTEDDLIVH